MAVVARPRISLADDIPITGSDDSGATDGMDHDEGRDVLAHESST